MAKIKTIRARQLIDCKCRPMVEVDVVTDNGNMGRGSAPTGSSVGMYESYVLRDHDPAEYDGAGVHKAVSNVTDALAPALVGMDIDSLSDLAKIDRRMIELDGTENKQRLGGNAIYSVSVAALRAAAAEAKVPAYRFICGRDVKTVPVPSFNVINGGKYGNVTLAFNESLLVPYRADSIYEAVEIAVKCFQKLGGIIKKFSGKEPMVGRSFGWATPSDDPMEVLSLMQDAVDQCGYHDKVAFALDGASSGMYDPENKTYLLKKEQVTSDALIAYLKTLTETFPMVFVEDPLDENDWEAYPKAVSALTKTIIIGDDLIVTNPKRLRHAQQLHAVDGFILKPNQVGTITEALEAHAFAKSHGMFSITSGRAGGVVNDVVMDLAVGLELPFIKNGAPRSGERIDKLNFLMRACDTTPGCVLADMENIVRF